jgi:hypothetical protein
LREDVPEIAIKVKVGSSSTFLHSNKTLKMAKVFFGVDDGGGSDGGSLTLPAPALSLSFSQQRLPATAESRSKHPF